MPVMIKYVDALWQARFRLLPLEAPYGCSFSKASIISLLRRTSQFSRLPMQIRRTQGAFGTTQPILPHSCSLSFDLLTRTASSSHRHFLGPPHIERRKRRFIPNIPNRTPNFRMKLMLQNSHKRQLRAGPLP